MKGKLFQIALLAAPLLFTGCSKPQPASASPPKLTEIKGQVFVIQKNRVNVKLGGVEVHYVPRETFEKRCRWIKESLPEITLFASYLKDLQHIDSVIQENSSGKHAGRIRDFLSSTKDRQLDAWKSLNGSPALEDYRSLVTVAELYHDSLEEAGFGRNKEDQWALNAFFFGWAEAHAAISTQTDADGTYILNLPAPGDGFVFAKSSRQLSNDQSESYYWIQEVSPSISGPVHLSTNNQLSPLTLSDFIKPSPEPDATSPSDFVKEYKLCDLSWFTEAETLLRQIAKNAESVSKLKSKVERAEVEIEKTMYMDMGTP
jgi:hypothetical protein